MVSSVILQAYLDERISFTHCLEILAVACGRKRIARFTGNGAHLKDLETLMGRISMPCAIAPLHLEPVFSGPLGDHFGRVAHGLPHGEEEGVLFLGPPDFIEAAVDMELHGCAAEQAAELYGYPLCCARNYERAIQHGAYWVDSFLAGIRGIMRAPWLMNRFGRLFVPHHSILPDYFPCHINCSPSLALAGTYHDMLEQEGLHALIALVKGHLARTVLRHAGCLYMVSQPEIEKEETVATVLAVWPYASQVLDTEVLSIRQEEGDIFVTVPGKTRVACGAEHPATCLIFA
jgi:hypothetical protein